MVDDEDGDAERPRPHDKHLVSIQAGWGRSSRGTAVALDERPARYPEPSALCMPPVP